MGRNPLTCDTNNTREIAREQGLRIYYNGPCKYGHLSGRRVSNGSCIDCVSQWYKNNPESNRKAVANYIKNNKDKCKERLQEWRKNNPTAYKAQKHIRRNKDNGVFTVEDINKLRKDQNGLCNYCTTDLAVSEHIDHIKPISKGGSNWPDNLQLLCQPCNQRKAAKYPYFYEESSL